MREDLHKFYALCGTCRAPPERGRSCEIVYVPSCDYPFLHLHPTSRHLRYPQPTLKSKRCHSGELKREALFFVSGSRRGCFASQPSTHQVSLCTLLSAFTDQFAHIYTNAYPCRQQSGQKALCLFMHTYGKPRHQHPLRLPLRASKPRNGSIGTPQSILLPQQGQ
jgi:hypothetical protein